MKCSVVRETLSAQLDGEALPADAGAAAQHAHSCPECGLWQRNTASLRRRMMLGVAPTVPDLTSAILAAAPPSLTTQPRRRAHVFAALRGSLIAVSLVLGSLAVAEVVCLVHCLNDRGGPTPMAHEVCLSHFAISVVLLWAAWRPAVSSRVMPVVVTLSILWVVMAWHGILQGTEPRVNIPAHIMTLVAGALLAAVGMAHRRWGRSMRPSPVIQ